MGCNVCAVKINVAQIGMIGTPSSILLANIIIDANIIMFDLDLFQLTHTKFYLILEFARNSLDLLMLCCWCKEESPLTLTIYKNSL